jgi:arachidonate 15-lipoxygenase
MTRQKRQERRAATPSRYRLPQQCSPDRVRAREATLALQRTLYLFQQDRYLGHPDSNGAKPFELPDSSPTLPAGEEFGPDKSTRLAIHKAVLKIRAPYIKWRLRGSGMDSEQDYVRAFGRLRDPAPLPSWRSDAEFARQRLMGVNPMSIKRCPDLPDGALADAAQRVLVASYRTTLLAAQAQLRVFCTDYRALLDPRIQSQVQAGATLAAPFCLFYVTVSGDLLPLAIELARPGLPSICVTPLDRRGDWMLAKAHAQSADAHFHEGIFHLLETHMVSEVFKICTARQLHPDHPLNQLLTPHFEWNLAIDDVARGHILASGGPIDVAMAAGAGGALDAARLWWSDWSFEKRRFGSDLAIRGVESEKTLPNFRYREDASLLHDAIGAYVKGVLGVWYRSDKDVRDDAELSAWSDELALRIPDFPPGKASDGTRTIDTTTQLFDIITEVIFRATAQHSAVNNGQYDTYGFAPNAPAAVFAPVPDPALDGPDPLDEQDVFRAMPPLHQSLAQLGMSWVLSQPTHRSIFSSGESPAFAQQRCLEAYEHVQAFRSRLDAISDIIGRRNRGLAIPYTYLDPHNVGRSTGI